MKKYVFFYIIGALIVIIGALLKITMNYQHAEYFYIVGLIIELFSLVKIINTLIKNNERK